MILIDQEFIKIEFAKKHTKQHQQMIQKKVIPFDIPNQESFTFMSDLQEYSNQFSQFKQKKYPQSSNDCFGKLLAAELAFMPPSSQRKIKLKAQNLQNDRDYQNQANEDLRKQSCNFNIKSACSLNNGIYQQAYSPSIRHQLSIVDCNNAQETRLHYCQGCLKWSQFAKQQKMIMLNLQKMIIEKQEALNREFKIMVLQFQTQTKKYQNIEKMFLLLKSQNQKNVALLNKYQLAVDKVNKQSIQSRVYSANFTQSISKNGVNLKTQGEYQKRLVSHVIQTNNTTHLQKKILAASNLWQNTDISRINKNDQTTYQFTCTDYINQNENQLNCKLKKINKKGTEYHESPKAKGIRDQLDLKQSVQTSQLIKRLNFDNKNLRSYNEVLTENLHSKKHRKFF